MSVRIASWGTTVLLLSVFLAGCANTDSPRRLFQSSSSVRADNPCRLNQASCDYKGHYEAGEREYAEQEARRLNLAEVRRLQRGF